MTDLIEDYLRQVEANLRTEPERKRQILDEMRGHLREKVRDAHAASPNRADDEIQRDVLREFGNPRDLAVAYEPEGQTVLRSVSTGEVVLRIGRAAARGTGTVLKWTAIAVGVLLVLTMAVGIWAFYEVRPYIEGLVEENVPVTVYDYYEQCDRPCGGAAFNETFYVHPEARDVRFDLTVRGLRESGNASGNLTVTVRDPSGDARYSRTISLQDDGYVAFDQRWATEAGNWTITYDFDAFVGRVYAQAETTGIRLRD